MKLIKASLFALLLSVVLISCSDDTIVDTPPTLSGSTAKNVAADTGKTGKRTFFRFADSTIVTGADTATNKWDIAFLATTIYINGGSSGIGTGGAQIVSGDFASVKEAPETGYKVDAVGDLAIKTGSDNGWYHYDGATMIISPIAGKILVIRGGNGKYTKVQIKSYYKDAPAAPDVTSKSRYYTFQYTHQADGSRKFE